MYNSGVTLSDIITELSGEVDIAGSIPDSAYIRWVNTLEQLIYTDILGFYGRQNVTLAGGGFALSSITSGTGEDSCRYDDIVKVYGDGREYVRAGVISSVIFDGDKGIYWQDGDSVKVSPIVEPDTVTVCVCDLGGDCGFIGRSAAEGHPGHGLGRLRRSLGEAENAVLDILYLFFQPVIPAEFF